MKEKMRSSSIRLTCNAWEHLRVRAFEERMSKVEYIRKLVEKDMEAKNAEAAK